MTACSSGLVSVVSRCQRRGVFVPLLSCPTSSSCRVKSCVPHQRRCISCRARSAITVAVTVTVASSFSSVELPQGWVARRYYFLFTCTVFLRRHVAVDLSIYPLYLTLYPYLSCGPFWYMCVVSVKLCCGWLVEGTRVKDGRSGMEWDTRQQREIQGTREGMGLSDLGRSND